MCITGVRHYFFFFECGQNGTYLRTSGFTSYGLSTPDVLPNFPVRCLRFYRVLMFNELKQKRRDFQWIVAVFGYTVLRTVTEMTVDFLTVLIHT